MVKSPSPVSFLYSNFLTAFPLSSTPPPLSYLGVSTQALTSLLMSHPNLAANFHLHQLPAPNSSMTPHCLHVKISSFSLLELTCQPAQPHLPSPSYTPVPHNPCKQVLSPGGQAEYNPTSCSLAPNTQSSPLPQLQTMGTCLEHHLSPHPPAQPLNFHSVLLQPKKSRRHWTPFGLSKI